MTPGTRLVYVMGASGSGKDTLLRQVAAASGPPDRIVVAHRYITRPSGPDEASVALSPEEFERRRELGGFALHWNSHGLSYGIGVEIDAWMAAGITVLVNGSRAFLPHAWTRYPGLRAVQVVADRETLRRRLAARGREDESAIDARLIRAAATYETPAACQIHRLDNSGAPAQAAAILLQIARRQQGA